MQSPEQWPVTEQTAWIQGSAPCLQPEFLARPQAPLGESILGSARNTLGATCQPVPLPPLQVGGLGNTSTQPHSLLTSPYPSETSQMAVVELTSHLSNVLLCDNSEPFVKQVLKPQTINQHQFKC